MKLPEEIFSLSKEQEKLSLSIYGKVIKCLVAPYHSYEQLEKMLTYSPTTFLFPEKSIDHQKERGFISLISKNGDNSEYRIVTTSMSIIGDMVDGCVRVLTERGDIVACPIKTFSANIHSIRHELLENDKFALSKEEKNASYNFIQSLLDEINSAIDKGGATEAEKSNLLERVSLIGEKVIQHRLRGMANEILVIA
jgi:hypothetical protein